ncbi:MAG TPA: hypothetical protein VMF90_26330 [Rhizobiaceae bacterium]|nr:hypothetical protein [Rhizobiaceae bacterium]
MKFVLKSLLGCFTALIAAPAFAESVLYVEDRALLAQLEEKGYGFEGLFGYDRGDLDHLYATAPAYRTIVDTISADVAELRAEIEAAGRPLAEFTKNETGRVMDMQWLSSSASTMRLVGVVNRLDRRDFHDLRREQGCGEVRFIYRLGYAFQKDGKGKVLSSRMPFNFNAVYDVLPDADGGCTGVAMRWSPAIDEALDAGWLAGGPLDPSELKFRQLELNAQMVRFPSGQEPQFGGQAVYLMRIFGIDGESATELPLENTPDAARLAEDAVLKAELVSYLRDNTAAVDTGVYMLPDKFLAKKIVSYSTFGSARPVNHPFSSLFKPADFAGLDLAGGTLVKSPEALIARLDNGTCQGCHQSGSTAGFHVIGLDAEGETSPLNRILVGISPHLIAELPRREAYVDAVAEEREPNRFRPLSFAPPAGWDEDGAPAYAEADAGQQCVLPKDQALMGGTWGCGGGTVCTALAETEGTNLKLAQCLMPADSTEMFSGHPCLAGDVVANAAEPFNDAYTTAQFTAFAAKASPRSYTCRPPRIGVPGGMAYRQCDEKDRAFAKFKDGGEMPREVCGLTGGKKFDICVSSGNVDQCLAGAVQRGNRAACSLDHPCRDDYICQAFPDDTPNAKTLKGQVGFCSPTYFMFQMRIDNHTTPWESEADRSFDDEPIYRSVEVDGDPDELW